MNSAITTVDATGDDTTIWRYMDLPKFVWMLAKRDLWFTKAAEFRDDPYEGFCKAEHREFPSDEYGPGPTILPGRFKGGSQIEISPERLFAELSYLSAETCRNARDHLYVNSWCLAPESMAMWQIYGSLAQGIAVTSSVGQYQRAAKFNFGPEQYRFGRVEYHDDIESCEDIRRDFRTGSTPMSSNLWDSVLRLGFHKRVCYKYENEWRAALYQDFRPGVSGVHIAFDLEQLISGVYVGPQAEEFFFDAVSSIMDKFLLRKPLERSALLNPPAAAAQPGQPASV
jgi:hypothetical protein